MSEEEKSNLIEAYLSGKLSKEEILLVQQLQQKDPQFRAELKDQQLAWEALGPSRLNAFRTLVGEVIAEHPREEKYIRKKLVPGRVLAIAAGIAGLLLALWWLLPSTSTSGQQLFATYFTPPPTSTVFRGEMESSATGALEDAQNRIDSLYRSQNYSQALDQLSVLGQQFPESRSSDYFFLKGILYLCNDQAASALMAFEQISVGFPTEKKWYTGLALLKLDSLPQAKAVFVELNQKDSPYGEESQAILKLLPE